ncbi:MAG: undecaprenyl-diphosphate phosphatase [Gemmatimonadota bacterium]
MSPWESLLLGVVQGATEFLPVSSSGHLVMSQVVLGVDLPGILFEVVVHVATLASVLWVYRARVGRLVAGSARAEGDALRYVGLLLLASVPAGVVGVFFKDALESLFDRPFVAGVALLVTGALLWSTLAARRWRGEDEGTQPGPRDALLMGLAQAVAIVPGISRSGTTVVVGLWLGVEAREAAAFSFLMSVPAIAGAAVLSIPDLSGGSVAAVGAAPFALGGVAAAFTGVLAIRTFVAMLENRSFHRFALYCWLVGSAFLAYLLLRP